MLQIVPFQREAHAQAFLEMNMEWLLAEDLLEAQDELQLAHPESSCGPHLLIALLEGRPVGSIYTRRHSLLLEGDDEKNQVDDCCAENRLDHHQQPLELSKHQTQEDLRRVHVASNDPQTAAAAAAAARWELGKFCVLAEFRRRGIGRRLLMAAMDTFFRERNVDAGECVLFLETNRKLVAANELYRQFGFHVAHKQMHYESADLYLELRDFYEVVPFEPSMAPAWESLMRGWIEKLFQVEPSDLQILQDPQGTVVDKGGRIWFAQLKGRSPASRVLCGAVALKKHAGGRYELSKLATEGKFRRMGIAASLCETLVQNYCEEAHKSTCTTSTPTPTPTTTTTPTTPTPTPTRTCSTCLFLETNSSLRGAISLYEKLGFQRMEFPTVSPFSRADYYMEFAH